MTAGRDSMRCYRLRGGDIRGMSVRRTGGAGPLSSDPAAAVGSLLIPPAGGGASGAAGGPPLLPGTAAPGAALGSNTFTAIAYEAGAAAGQAGRRFAFVGSAAGVVFQVDYPRRCVVAAYQAHGGAINALTVGEGVAVTAGDDGFLRVWLMDFRAYLLEAEHESPVTSAALAAGGLALAVGGEDGALGVLDLASHRYAALLRSHCGAVEAVAVHPTRWAVLGWTMVVGLRFCAGCFACLSVCLHDSLLSNPAFFSPTQLGNTHQLTDSTPKGPSTAPQRRTAPRASGTPAARTSSSTNSG